MDLKTAKLIYFSPTQTTRQVLQGIARGTEVEAADSLDLTPPAARTALFEELHDELAVFGAPVYGGRIPLVAVHRLRRLKGNDTPAVVVVVYGNRAYEDALLELRDLVSKAGFRPVAGGAFIGEHSFSTEATPIAHGRPDAQDLGEAETFGRMIREKLAHASSLGRVPPLQVPGNRPYKERGKGTPLSPITQEEPCTTCGTCATVCPTAAIAVEDTVVTDAEACILCCACVKNCPNGARVMDDPRLGRTVAWLSQHCGERKEPEVYV